jgi:hypothetical protein
VLVFGYPLYGWLAKRFAVMPATDPARVDTP